VKKVRPYIDKMDDHYREMRSIERKLAALKGNKKASPQIRELKSLQAESAPANLPQTVALNACPARVAQPACSPTARA
jgi:hypothetical protein